MPCRSASRDSTSSWSSPIPRTATAPGSEPGAALGAAPEGPFDVVLAPAGTVLSGLDARSAILVGQDGSAWRLALP
jgi:hypothetical protein